MLYKAKVEVEGEVPKIAWHYYAVEHLLLCCVNQVENYGNKNAVLIQNN